MSSQPKRFPVFKGARPARRGTPLVSAVLALILAFTTAGAALAIFPIVNLANGEQNAVILGDRAFGYMSEVIGAADFNGDGFDDLLLGAGGNNRNGAFAGAAYVVLGSSSLPAKRDLSSAPASLTMYGKTAGDVFGHAIAAGDVNGDGVSDIIVSADNWSSGRGAVYVFMGGKSGFPLKPVIDLAASDTAAVTILGQSAGNRFGRALAAEDIDGDKIDDIIIGAYQAWPGGRREAGTVYVIRGRTGFSGTIDLSQNVTQAALVVYGAGGAPAAAFDALKAAEASVPPLFADEVALPDAEIGDRLGRSVAAADVNGDGIGDLIAGAYGANVGGAVDAGRAYVFYGSSAYATGHKAVDLAANPGGASATLSGIDAGDQAGFFVSSGNLNGGPAAEVLVGAYFSRGVNNAAPNAGEVYVVNGGSIPASMSLSAANMIVYGAAAGDRLGRSLSAGDINKDGLQDLLAGASRADPNGRMDAGVVYVLFGRANLGGPVYLSNLGSASIMVLGAHSTGVVCNKDDNPASQMDCSDEAGHSVSSGDLNNDGFDDIIVGALYANNGSKVDAGASYILYGGSLQQPDFPKKMYLPYIRR